MKGSFDVERNSTCVGLLMLWSEQVVVDLLSFSDSHIDITVDEGQGKFRFTGMYGQFCSTRKHETWSLINTLRGQSNLPWLLGGDLNEILDREEKYGGRRQPRVHMEGFKDTLLRNDLWDIRPSRGWFTWQTGEGARVYVKERLDRFCASIPWLHEYGRYEVRSEFTFYSDHHFVWLDTDGPREMGRMHSDYFKFEPCWAGDEECLTRVKDAWQDNHSSTLGKINAVRVNLRDWQKHKMRDQIQLKKSLTERLEELMAQPTNVSNFRELSEVKRNLKQVLDREERYWRQRLRVQWLTERDRNTSFFHACANGRKKKNWIREIKDAHGNLVEGTGKVMEVAVEFFSNLYRSNGSNPASRILEAVETCITPDMNANLCAGFTAVEVKDAFIHIHPNKAPGIDGLPSSFFRRFWSVCGEDFVSLCLDILNGKIDFAEVNQTVIVLIPKVDKPDLIKQYRPISLCNVVYKTCAKVLVNRLRPLMNTCIAPNQSAFVPGRLISDNVLITHEIMHYLKSSKNGPNKGSAIKLDMEKAYDRVEWFFLSTIMSKLGFDDRPSRGLRQGDPLSPYLFLFCTQGLSTLLLKEQREGNIKGVRASQAGPRVNHLLYADDCILFIKNSVGEATGVKEVLKEYERCSGQRVNVDKSAIYFSSRMTEVCKAQIQAILNMREEKNLGTYLGLPLIVGKNKTDDLGFLNVRVDKKVCGWTKNLLSFGGREVLINAVVQALPAYAMACFLLPDCIVDPMVKTMRNFWWSGKAHERGWTFVAWEKLCKAKPQGGMGFRNLKLFNLALLGKQVWRLMTNKDTLCYKVLSAKYFKEGNVLDAKMKDKASFIWKDGWGWDASVCLEGQYMESPLNPIRCKEFMVPGTNTWDSRKVEQVFNARDAKAILDCPIARTNGDSVVWSKHSKGLYTTRSGHRWLLDKAEGRNPESIIWKRIAKLAVLPKIRIFGWRLGQEAFPVGNKLRAADLGDGMCKLCGTHVETVLHAFRECSKVKEVLLKSGLECRLPQGPYRNCLEWLEAANDVLNLDQFTFLMVLLWNAWNRRNRWVHDNQLIPARLVSEYAQIVKGDFHKVCERAGEPVQCDRSKKWMKPGPGQVKINVDGAWLVESRVATIGVIARDHHGMMINGCALQVAGAHSVETVEACAFATGIRMAIEKGWENVVVEGDSMSIINRLKDPGQDLSVEASFLVDTKAALQTHPGVMVQHVARDANRAAHYLAHFRFTAMSDFHFDVIMPDAISNIVISDAIFSE
ncbi:hypothetical protein GQ457_11G002870 [Hibiscus cannabinus]